MTGHIMRRRHRLPALTVHIDSKLSSVQLSTVSISNLKLTWNLIATCLDCPVFEGMDQCPDVEPKAWVGYPGGPDPSSTVSPLREMHDHTSLASFRPKRPVPMLPSDYFYTACPSFAES
jgi:hypothetical protein